MLEVIWDDFTWQRPVSRKRGFAWDDTDEMRLVRVPDAAFKSYKPHPGIFREFADLEQTPKAVLAFANRCGTFRERLEFNSFSTWCQGIHQMQELVQLADAVIADDWRRIPKALEPFLAAPFLANAPETRLIHQKQKGGETISRDELAHAALTQLYKRVAPLERFGGTVGAWNADSGKVELRLKCNEMIDFMFLQLGRTLLGDLRVRQCQACGKWSLVAGAGRTDRATCSGYCRLKLSRKRREKALKLSRRGCPLREIATKVGSDVSQVKTWIAESKD
jgi:hypothetical protein